MAICIVIFELIIFSIWSPMMYTVSHKFLFVLCDPQTFLLLKYIKIFDVVIPLIWKKNDYQCKIFNLN